MMGWSEAQKFEAGWWGDCANTLGEEFKHPTYARLMGTPFVNQGGSYVIERHGKSVLDVGGGPASMLLCTQADRRTVVDPCPYPKWTQDRYHAAGIELVRSPAEEFVADCLYDEAWCYNVLQHVQDPQRVIDVMARSARTIRIAEWVDLPPHDGHPHELKSELLAEWGGFDTGWWSETMIGWDHFVGDPRYRPYRLFHGYAYTKAGE